MLQALYLFETRHRVEQLYPHWAQNWPSVQEEEIATAARMLDRVLDKVNDSVRLKFRAAAEAKITWIPKEMDLKRTRFVKNIVYSVIELTLIMFYSYVSHTTVESE